MRSYHLAMMIESLWNLEDYGGSLSWTEVAIHEALEAREKKSASLNTEQSQEKVRTIRTDYLKMKTIIVQLNNISA